MISRFKDVATLWQLNPKNEYGQDTFKLPIRVLVKWEEKAELFNKDGATQTVSNAILYTLETMKVGQFVKLGFDENETSLTPKDIIGSYRVLKVNFSFSLINNFRLFKVYL